MDATAVALVYAVVQLIAGLIESTQTPAGAFHGLPPAPRGFAFVAVSVLYFAWSWTRGGSPGQRALGLMTLGDDGILIDWNRAFLRWGYLYGPSAVVSIAGTPQPVVVFGATSTSTADVNAVLANLTVSAYYVFLLITAARDPMRRGFHDRQARTLVIAPRHPAPSA